MTIDYDRYSIRVFLPSGMAVAAITGCGESTPPGWLEGKELLESAPEGRHIVALVTKAIEAESAYEGAYHNAARTRSGDRYWSTVTSIRAARRESARAALTELAAKYPHQPEPHRYSQTGFAAEASQ